MKGADCLESLLLPRGFLGKQGGSLQKPNSWCRTLTGRPLWPSEEQHMPATFSSPVREKQTDRKMQKQRLSPRHLQLGLDHHTPSYLEWSLTGYSLTQNMSQVFWPKFQGYLVFLCLLETSNSSCWNSIDSGPA